MWNKPIDVIYWVNIYNHLRTKHSSQHKKIKLIYFNETRRQNYYKKKGGKLEKQEDLKNSLNDYQELIKLNNIIEKKFQKKSKNIRQDIKAKIESITNKKNAKQS